MRDSQVVSDPMFTNVRSIMVTDSVSILVESLDFRYFFETFFPADIHFDNKMVALILIYTSYRLQPNRGLFYRPDST
jgi:hypothetical protein